MKVKTTFLQQGGPVNAQPDQAAPAQGGAPAGGPEEQIAQMAQQIIQQVGPEAAAMLAQMIMQMLQGAAEPEQGQPAYQRQGGKLVRAGKR